MSLAFLRAIFLLSHEECDLLELFYSIRGYIAIFTYLFFLSDLWITSNGLIDPIKTFAVMQKILDSNQ